MPNASIPVMERALKEFADYHNPKNNKIIILLIDRAGWHTSEKLNVPVGIELFPLPPYTPELQPAESINPLLKESIANRSFVDLGALEKKLIDRCRWLIDNPEIVKGVAGFDWICRIEHSIN